ncbi:MAG: hypothetical protein ABR524_06160 [Thermoanaerobaculia bacterium]
MHFLRLVCVAAVALLLVTGCIRTSDMPPASPQIEEPVPLSLPPPPPPPRANFAQCSQPDPTPPAVVRIQVSDQGEVSPDDEIVCVKTGQEIQWYLTPTAGVKKKLEIRLPGAMPPRFVVTPMPNDMEVHAHRTGPPISYEEHKYDIHVWINGVERKVDPILIIRE